MECVKVAGIVAQRVQNRLVREIRLFFFMVKSISIKVFDVKDMINKV